MDSIPVSKTKIIVPPRRAELLSRPRLLESFDNILTRKLIMLSAPAGYGKTSLLIDLAHSTDLPVCWLSIDPLDRDPQRFMTYLIAALAEQFPTLDGPVRAKLDQMKSLEEETESLLISLTNELYDQVEKDFLLILDDFHLLDDAPTITYLLDRFIHLVDENCHIILSSRTLPSLPNLLLMTAREQVEGISHTELAFLPQEVQALFAQNYSQHISDESAHQLVDQTGGWITGMVLNGLPHISGVDAFSYLGQQVLAQQPESLRKFLLRTSIPDEFNIDLCEATLSEFYPEPQNWSSFISMILEKNLFVLPVGAGGRWYRYHPLFREFLQAQLQAELPDEAHPLLVRLTYAYEDMGEWEKAYFTCQQLDDLEALASVVERAGTSMLQHALTTLESWINSLPPSVIHARPGLISLRGGIANNKGHPQEAIVLLNKAESFYRKEKDIGGLALTLTRRATAYRLMGDYLSSMQDVQEVLRLAEPHPDLQPSYAEALRIKGLCLYRLGKSRQAVESLNHSLSLYIALKEKGSIPLLLMESGMAYRAIGDIEAAKKSYREALGIWQAENNLYLSANLLNNLAVLHHLVGEYELAAETFDAALECARKSHNTRTEALILIGLGDIYAELDEFATTARAYQEADAMVSEVGESFTRNYLLLARANLAYLRGDREEARHILEENAVELKASNSSYEYGLRALLEGQILLADDKPKQAIAVLRKSKTCFTQDGRELESMRSHIWLAAALNYAGQKDAACAEIHQILAQNGRNDHALLVALRQAIPWLKGLENEPQIGRTLRGLFEKMQRLNAKIPATRRALRRLAQSIQMPSPGLNIQAFGRAEVKVNGKSVSMSAWHTQSVRDLFFYFLFKNKPVTKEQVFIELWPEIDDPRTLQSRFRNEMYRLRRAVGKEVIVFDDVYYSFNHAMDYEYDVEAFDSHLALAHFARTDEDRIEHYRKAVNLVHGPYLINVDSNWASEERERLGQKHLNALEELASLYLNRNELEQAIISCQRALEFDPYHESIYRLAMRAHAVRGDRAAIIRLFQACEGALHELGLSPSEETQTLYQQLTAGKGRK